VEPAPKRKGGRPKNTGDATSFSEAQRRKELALARLRELEVRRVCDELIERTRVAQRLAIIGQAYREAWLNWPARVAAVLAAGIGTDGLVLHRALEDAVHAQLTELADLTAAGKIG